MEQDVLTEQGKFLAPYLPKDRRLIPAWLDCFSWALQESVLLAAFRQETGNTWEPSASPIEQMIDTATGREQEFFTQFAAWMNVNVWAEACEKHRWWCH